MIKELELLGKRVRYARVHPGADGKPEIAEGTGNIVSVHLAIDNRPQVRVLDGYTPEGKAKLYNIDMPAIEATPEGVKKYFDHVCAIQVRASEINENNKKLVAQGNAEIEAMNVEYLGAPVVIEGAEANDNAAK